MPRLASDKSIEELCKDQAKHAKYYHWLSYSQWSVLKDSTFNQIARDTPLDLSLSRPSTKQDIIDGLESLANSEEAYGIIQGSALTCTDIMLELRHDISQSIYYQISSLPNFCVHYDRCKVRIYGPDHSYLLKGEIVLLSETHLTPYKTVTLRGIYLRFDKIYAKHFTELLNTIRSTSLIFKLVIEPPIFTRSILVSFGKAFGQAIPGSIIEGRNFSIPCVMFDFNERERMTQRQCENDEPRLRSDKYDLGFFGDRSMDDAIRARQSFDVQIPMIVRKSVWTNQPVWLKALIDNIATIDKAKIGVLFPSNIKEDIQKQLEQSDFVKLIPGHQETGLKLDYLIIYQAHSISVTAAIHSMAEVQMDGTVMLIGDPSMPNLRIGNLQVRRACGSVLNWFYDRERYPEYFEHDRVYSTLDPVCIGYNPQIFDFFNNTFYNGELINPTEFDCDAVQAPMIFSPVKGSAVVLGCSPYNMAEVTCCLEWINGLVEAGVKRNRIGVLTTYCAQKKAIKDRCHEEVFVGILQDFEYLIRDYLIISTVETAERTSGGKQYLFSDLLYDRLCLNLAVTRATSQIIIVGDGDVLNGIEHWKKFLGLCQSEEDVKPEPHIKTEPNE